MFDADAPSSQRVRARLERRGTWKRLVWIARWSTRELSRAEDLVQETVLRVMNPEDLPWDGARPFLSFMSFVLRHVFCDWTRLRREQEIPVDAEEIAKYVRSSDPPPDEALDLARAKQRDALLGARLAKELGEEDVIERRCLELWAAGLDVGQQASALGCTVERVLAAQRLLTRRGMRIRREYDAAERDRMNALRAGAAAVPPAPPSGEAIP